MEIHAPHRPVKTIREFLGHIFVVTVGILIALWFDGLKERAHDRQLVSEARENFRLDIEQDREHLKAEIKSLDDALTAVHGLLAAGAPANAAASKPALSPGFYFFRSTSWETALSTGALARMEPAEVVRYAEMHEAVKTYSDLQRVALGVFVEYQALESQTEKTAEAGATIRNRLAVLEQDLKILRHLATELTDTLEQAAQAVSG